MRAITRNMFDGKKIVLTNRRLGRVIGFYSLGQVKIKQLFGKKLKVQQNVE